MIRPSPFASFFSFRILASQVDLPVTLKGSKFTLATLKPPPVLGEVTEALVSVADFSKTRDNASSCQAMCVNEHVCMPLGGK